MKTILAVLLTASSLLASVQLVPVGAWPLCQSGLADSSFCAGQAGENSLLLIRAKSAAATGFVYEVSAKKYDGQAIKVSGYVARATGEDATHVLVPVGAVYDVKISVVEVVAVEVQTN